MEANNSTSGGESIKKIIKEHLENEHHQIQEDDIKNIQVGSEPDDVKTGAGAALKADLNSQENQGETGNEGKIITPWDVTK